MNVLLPPNGDQPFEFEALRLGEEYANFSMDSPPQYGIGINPTPAGSTGVPTVGSTGVPTVGINTRHGLSLIFLLFL